jgi:molybdopterin-guanine dinucleotide biosynthesis protein A
VALQQVLQDCQNTEIEWIWLLGCDLPRLDVEILRGWLQELPAHPRDCGVAVAGSQAGWEPLCAFYRPLVLPQLAGFIGAGGRSFQNWLDGVSRYQIPLGDAERQMLYNCNYPADLRGQP